MVTAGSCCSSSTQAALSSRVRARLRAHQQWKVGRCRTAAAVTVQAARVMLPHKAQEGRLLSRVMESMGQQGKQEKEMLQQRQQEMVVLPPVVAASQRASLLCARSAGCPPLRSGTLRMG